MEITKSEEIKITSVIMWILEDTGQFSKSRNNKGAAYKFHSR
jgi:hypothetical protein